MPEIRSPMPNELLYSMIRRNVIRLARNQRSDARGRIDEYGIPSSDALVSDLCLQRRSSSSSLRNAL